MVTSFPYYPTWQKRPEDRDQLYRTDLINGVPVHRCWHFVPARVSALKRIVHEGSFVFTSTLRALTLPRPDVYVRRLAALASRRRRMARRENQRRAVCFSCPGHATGRRGGARDAESELVYADVVWLESFAYRHAARVSGITQGMLKSFRGKGVPDTELVYFPNAIDLNDAESPPERGEFRRRHGFGAGGVSGDLRWESGRETRPRRIAGNSPLLRDPRIRILICGDGAQRESLAQRVRELELAECQHASFAGRPGLSRFAGGRGCLFHHAASRSREFFFPEQASRVAGGIETGGHGGGA